MKRESDRPQPPVVELAGHSYQPSRVPLREDHRVDTTFRLPLPRRLKILSRLQRAMWLGRVRVQLVKT